MKGVIASRVDATLIDIAHDIPRGDIAHAAWVVRTACPRFPDATVHVVVVDPGVGGTRRPVVVKTSRHYFVGPDNGVFGYLQPVWAHEIEITGPISATFHGRDVFAPAAAEVALQIAAKGKAALAGTPVELAGALPWGGRREGEGRIVHIDHYGNLITDLPPREVGDRVVIKGRTIAMARTYEDVFSGELLAYVGSARTIEVAVRDGSAQQVPGVTRSPPAAMGWAATPAGA